MEKLIFIRVLLAIWNLCISPQFIAFVMIISSYRQKESFEFAIYFQSSATQHLSDIYVYEQTQCFLFSTIYYNRIIE